jgi:hypothetical protein
MKVNKRLTVPQGNKRDIIRSYAIKLANLESEDEMVVMYQH